MKQPVSALLVRCQSANRIISPVMAALLMLQLTGCAFHTYEDVDRKDWAQIESGAKVRVTMNDSTVHKGKLGSASLTSDSLVLNRALDTTDPGRQTPSAIWIITNTHLIRTDSSGFRSSRVQVDSAVIADSDVDRIQMKKSATGANVVFWIAVLGGLAALLGAAATDAAGEAAGAAFGGAP